jgi:hypothetical protein
MRRTACDRSWRSNSGAGAAALVADRWKRYGLAVSDEVAARRLMPAGIATIKSTPSPSGFLMLVIRLLVALLVVSTVLAWTPIDDFLADRVEVSDVMPEIGLAHVGKLSEEALSDHEKPSGALLYAVQRGKGTPMHKLKATLGEFYAFDWLLRFFDASFPGRTYVLWTKLGPGEAIHADIREKGDGRYSIWKGFVYLSLPRASAMPDRFVVLIPYAG